MDWPFRCPFGRSLHPPTRGLSSILASHNQLTFIPNHLTPIQSNPAQPVCYVLDRMTTHNNPEVRHQPAASLHPKIYRNCRYEPCNPLILNTNPTIHHPKITSKTPQIPKKITQITQNSGPRAQPANPIERLG